MTSRRRYSDFAARIDIDAFEEAIDFVPTHTDKNNNDVGYCPDIWGLHKHGDTTGKFAIHREKKVYGCWVCGGGNLLSLTMELKKMRESDAVDWLYQFASESAVSNEDFASEVERLLYTEIERKKPMPYFNERILDRLEEVPDWYALDKGISQEVLTEFKVKYDPEHQRGNYQGPAIVFPHFWQGRLVGWQERWLDDDKPKYVPKYTNTSDFPREFTLYNYEREYFSKEIAVVESVPTVLFLLTLGIPAVATFGSSVTKPQMKYLRSCTNGLVIAPDNDEPGVKCAEALYKGLNRFVPLKMVEPVGEFDSGDDLGDVGDPDTVRELVKNAEYLY